MSYEADHYAVELIATTNAGGIHSYTKQSCDPVRRIIWRDQREPIKVAQINCGYNDGQPASIDNRAVQRKPLVEK